MAAAIALFSGAQITEPTFDSSRVVATDGGWISVGVTVIDVHGADARIGFRVQWSFDNATWADALPLDEIGSTDVPATMVQRFNVKAPYWRLAIDLSGPDAVAVCSANALT